MGIVKDRCVCEICSCGKHHCGPQHNKFKVAGKLDHLTNQGDHYAAPKATFKFPDTLALFEGAQDLNSIQQKDFKGHAKVGVERPKPQDLLKLSTDKMEGLTVNKIVYPGHDIAVPTVTAGGAISLESAPKPNVKMNLNTSYGDQFTGEGITGKASHTVRNDQLAASKGELDLTTINKADYVPFEYGRPQLHSIPDNNVFGVGDEDLVSKETTTRRHYPGFTSSPAQPIKGEDSKMKLGDEARVTASVYGVDFKRSQPAVRKSKRRGTEVNFGGALDHTTSYASQFEGKSLGRTAPAKFDDKLALFSGEQDLQTIVRADYQPHSKVGVERHKPKDLIEIPNEKMTSETVTLGHFPAPPLASQGTVAEAQSIPNVSDSSKNFDISQAMPKVKMASETSYKNEFPKKEVSKTNKATFKDEIPANTGDIDLNTLHRADFTKFAYGRPQIHKMKDENIFGVNYDIGRKPKSIGMQEEDVVEDADLAGISVSRGSVRSVQAAPVDNMEVVSLPGSRASSLGVSAEKVVAVKAGVPVKSRDEPLRSAYAISDDKGPKKSTYGADFQLEGGRMRHSKKRDATINFGSNFYADTSYANDFTSKKCLVPSLDQLDEYTFKAIKDGHRIYKVDCLCPPRGACGCPPPQPATVG